MSLFANLNHIVVATEQNIIPLDGKMSFTSWLFSLWEIIKSYIQTLEPTLATLGAIGSLGGIAFGVFKFLRWLYLHRKAHQDEHLKLRETLRRSYTWVDSITTQQPSVRNYVDAVNFYVGATSNSLQSVSLDWLAQREDVALIIKNHFIKPPRSYCHIHIEGHRRQGKTAALWLLAHQLAKVGTYEVLWHNQKTDLLPPELGKYAKNLASRPVVFLIRKIFGKSSKRLIVFLDDFEANISQEFLRALNGYQLSLVTASTPGQQLLAPVYHLRLTPVDVEQIVNTFNNKLALSNPIALENVMIHLKGVRGFDYDLVSLMYQLLRISIEKDREIIQSFLDCVKKNEDGFKYVAVCEALELEAFESLIGFCVNAREPHIFEGQLLHNAEGWLVMKKLSYANGEGLALSSPFLAVWLLTEHYKIDAPKFYNLLDELIKKIDNPTFLNMDVAQEFLRHIFHKLGKGRHLHFPGLNGRVLGKELFSKYMSLVDSIIVKLSNKGDIDRLCRWANTASLMGNNNLSEKLCKEIITQLTGKSIKVTNDATFVTFVNALTSMDKEAVQRTLEQLFDLDQVISEFTPGDYNAEFRFNEIIHAYTGLLWRKLRDINKALAVYEKVSHCPLDPLNLCQRASLLREVNLEQAKDAYETALSLAYSPKYHQMNPGHTVRCHFEYARFLCISESDKDTAWREFQKAFDLARPTPGSGLNPELVPDILCAWAQCLEKRKEFQKAWQKYEESMNYCSEALYPPLSHWKTVQGVAKYRKLSYDPNVVKETIHIIENVLNDETVKLSKQQYDDGCELYKKCWGTWLRITDISLFDVKYIERALSQPWPSTFAAQLAHYLITGLLTRASNDKTGVIFVEHVIYVYEKLFQRPDQANNENAINALSTFVAGKKYASIGNVGARRQNALEILKGAMCQQVKNQAVWDALIWIGSQLHEETGRESLRTFVQKLVTEDASACEEFKKLDSKWKNEEGTRKSWRLEKVFPDAFRTTIYSL